MKAKRFGICSKCNTDSELVHGRRCKICIGKAYKIRHSLTKERDAKYKNEWYERNKQRINEKSKIYQVLNKEAIAANKKSYYEENKEILKKNIYARKKKRLSKDPIFKLKETISVRIRNFIRSKGFSKDQRTFDIIGYDINMLKMHLENQFKPGMTWENHGDWHIDHILPLASCKSKEEVYSKCHYTNLQPLWAEQNQSKMDKMPDGTLGRLVNKK